MSTAIPIRPIEKLNQVTILPITRIPDSNCFFNNNIEETSNYEWYNNANHGDKSSCS